MKFSIDTSPLSLQTSGCLVVGVFANGSLTPAAAKVDKLTQGYLHTLMAEKQFSGKLGQTFPLYRPANASLEILLVGCGEHDNVSAGNFRKIVSAAMRAVSAAKATCYLTDLQVKDRNLAWQIQQIVQITADVTYRFEQFKTEKNPAPLKTLNIFTAKSTPLATRALATGVAITDGIQLTKDLANSPSNICTPSYVANAAKSLAKAYKTLSIDILEEKALKKLGMGALLAVARGSTEKPKLVVVQYHGGQKKSAPVALVGKGITFDTGGISLKPADSMIGMKYDMCGAATVLGVLKTAAELKLPINIVGILALAENMPSGSAYKPEDIITTMSGQTVEVLNTDAEGRLVLADALTYCERFKPDTIIDIATLTGAVVVALGQHASGLLANNKHLEADLLAAGEESFDRAWALPLWEEYQEQLKSPFADMSNIGGRTAGAITAACFLSRFTTKYAWAHLDVAGTAAMMTGGTDRYATGRPIPLLVQYLLNKPLKKR